MNEGRHFVAYEVAEWDRMDSYDKAMARGRAIHRLVQMGAPSDIKVEDFDAGVGLTRVPDGVRASSTRLIRASGVKGL